LCRLLVFFLRGRDVKHRLSVLYDVCCVQCFGCLSGADGFFVFCHWILYSLAVLVTIFPGVFFATVQPQKGACKSEADTHTMVCLPVRLRLPGTCRHLDLLLLVRQWKTPYEHTGTIILRQKTHLKGSVASARPCCLFYIWSTRGHIIAFLFEERV
jgi:hypothetical protein